MLELSEDPTRPGLYRIFDADGNELARGKLTVPTEPQPGGSVVVMFQREREQGHAVG